MWKFHISQIIYFSVSCLGGHWALHQTGGGGVGGLYNALVTCQYVLSSRWWWWWSAEKMLTRCLLLTLIVIRSNYVPCSIPHLICRRLSLLIAESSLWWYQTNQSALTNNHVTELGKESPGGFRNEEKAQVNGLALSRSHPGGDWNILGLSQISGRCWSYCYFWLALTGLLLVWQLFLNWKLTVTLKLLLLQTDHWLTQSQSHRL